MTSAPGAFGACVLDTLRMKFHDKFAKSLAVGRATTNVYFAIWLSFLRTIRGKPK
jgi:hypothetical protein